LQFDLHAIGVAEEELIQLALRYRIFLEVDAMLPQERTRAFDVSRPEGNVIERVAQKAT